VVRAIKDAAEVPAHLVGLLARGQVRSARRIARWRRSAEPAMSFYCQSGPSAVEGALKLARYVTGRPRFIGFLGGFHGRTMGSLAFTASKYTQQAGFAPTMPGVTHVPYPNTTGRCSPGADQGKAVLRLHRERAVPVATCRRGGRGDPGRADPGRGRLHRAADGFLAGLRALCDRHGILLIFDEVQSGRRAHRPHVRLRARGREPDVDDARQGPGLGPADRLVVARQSLMAQWKMGAHGNTFGGNPVCCAAALATLDLVERPDGERRRGRRHLHGGCASSSRATR
jgi:4-aminobutyrate aminotransferase